MQPDRKKYLKRLSLIEKRENFSENMGIGDTNNQENSKISIGIAKDSTGKLYSCMAATPKAQKRALAGVGRPIKPRLCLSSILNLASLRAENRGRKKAE